MVLATTDKIEGKEHEVLGMVISLKTMRPQGLSEDVERMVFNAREEMEEKARQLEADAVVGVKFTSLGSVQDIDGTGLSKIAVYGTAVKFK